MTAEIVPSTNSTPAPFQDRRLGQTIAGFLIGYGRSTRDSYADALNQWVGWCSDNELDVFAVGRPHVDAYGRWLGEKRGYSPSTVTHRLCVLRAFYSFLEDEELIASSPAKKTRLPRQSTESSTRLMTSDEVSALLGVAKDNPLHYALVCLLALNGLRVSEVCAANIGDLGVEAEVPTLTVIRKGTKRQTVPLAPITLKAVENAIGKRTYGPLLLTPTGKRLGRSNAWKILHALGGKVGADSNVHPHRLRHSFVTMALDAGVPLHDVQDSVGHESPVTTRRYDRARNRLQKNATWAVSEILGGEDNAGSR